MIATGLVLSLVGLVWVGITRMSMPAASSEGQDWTYKELLEHFRLRGFQPLKMVPCKRGQFYMHTNDSESEVATLAMYVEMGVQFEIAQIQFVWVKSESTQKAKDLAGSKEKGTFAWGRFYFEGGDESLRFLRQALTERTTMEIPPPQSWKLGNAIQ
ncbi:MAG: hypothetical protein C0467_30195 [Planctomycetaceae bacterium]|nr:hypothetical protein [Planctomycetaceae bacterium]